jgi:hypothetical protein
MLPADHLHGWDPQRRYVVQGGRSALQGRGEPSVLLSATSPPSRLVAAVEARDAAQARLVQACRERDALRAALQQQDARIALLASYMTPDLTELTPAGVAAATNRHRLVRQPPPVPRPGLAAELSELRAQQSHVDDATRQCADHYGVDLAATATDPTEVVERMTALVAMLQRIERSVVALTQHGQHRRPDDAGTDDLEVDEVSDESDSDQGPDARDQDIRSGARDALGMSPPLPIP